MENRMLGLVVVVLLAFVAFSVYSNNKVSMSGYPVFGNVQARITPGGCTAAPPACKDLCSCSGDKGCVSHMDSKDLAYCENKDGTGTQCQCTYNNQNVLIGCSCFPTSK